MMSVSTCSLSFSFKKERMESRVLTESFSIFSKPTKGSVDSEMPAIMKQLVEVLCEAACQIYLKMFIVADTSGDVIGAFRSKAGISFANGQLGIIDF